MARYQLNDLTDVGLEGGPDSNYQPSMDSYSWIDYLFNPVAQITGIYNGLSNAGSWIKSKFDQLGDYIRGTGTGESELDKAISSLYDDMTGKSQVKLQNELNREMAEEEYHRNLQSIGDTAAAYEAAGFNRNILYGGSNGSPVSYSAPQLQSYSGSAKLDTVLNKVSKVLGIIPAMYQATAALESIDQQREKTAQSQLRTTALGMDLIEKAHRIDDRSLGKPYDLEIPLFHDVRTRSRLRRHQFLATDVSHHHGIDNEKYSSYMDSAYRWKKNLLDSIQLKNNLARTRNDYLGYQYDLDRRFGAAGKLVGMAAQGIGSASNLLKSVGSLKKPNNYDRIYYPSGYSQVYH